MHAMFQRTCFKSRRPPNNRKIILQVVESTIGQLCTRRWERLWPKLFVIEDNRREWAHDCFSFLEHHGYRRINGSGNIMLARQLPDI